MSPDEAGRNDDVTSGEADLGEPVQELSRLTLAAGPGFHDRVRQRIEGRMLVGDVIGLVWSAPLLVLLELLRVPFEFLTTRRRDRP